MILGGAAIELAPDGPQYDSAISWHHWVPRSRVNWFLLLMHVELKTNIYQIRYRYALGDQPFELHCFWRRRLWGAAEPDPSSAQPTILRSRVLLGLLRPYR